MGTTSELRVEQRDENWVLTGLAVSGVLRLCNDYLGFLADRNYAAGTRRSYAFDLLAFARWLTAHDIEWEAVGADALLRFLASCRAEGLATATTNRRMAAISGLFTFRSMRDPSLANPMPKSATARRAAASQREGLLGHLARPEPRSALRVRQPRRLPRGLDRMEVMTFLASLRTWRDKAVAGLMLFSGLRSCEVLALDVADVDIARGWARVAGKGGRERQTPVDAEVAGWVQTYLLVERPVTDTPRLFVVAKGRNRGQPLTPAGLRAIFRYHRTKTGVSAAHPHALRHSFGTALAEAGVDLAVIQALLGHVHVDSSAGYIHLAPVRVRAAFDQARQVQRVRQ
jgi:site-specific recombinase XerD